MALLASVAEPGSKTELYPIHANRLDTGVMSLSRMIEAPLRDEEAEADGRAAAFRADFEAYYADAGVDTMARELLVLLDTIQTTFLMTTTFQEIGIPTDSATQFLHMEDGSVVTQETDVVLLQGMAAQSVLMDRLAAGERVSFAEGEVRLAAEGTCPFASGPAQLVGRGIAFEVARGAEPLLFCIPGDSRVFCLASEPTIVSLTISEDSADLSFGYGRRAVNCEVYEADAGLPARLIGGNWDDCRIELAAP